MLRFLAALVLPTILPNLNICVIKYSCLYWCLSKKNQLLPQIVCSSLLCLILKYCFITFNHRSTVRFIAETINFCTACDLCGNQPNEALMVSAKPNMLPLLR